MSYHNRLAEFFESKGISQQEISKKVDFSPVMISRYLSKNRLNIEFINAITNAYPSIDWNYILKDEETMLLAEEAPLTYSKSPKELIREIENNIKELRKWHESDTEEL